MGFTSKTYVVIKRAWDLFYSSPQSLSDISRKCGVGFGNARNIINFYLSMGMIERVDNVKNYDVKYRRIVDVVKIKK